MRAARQTSMWSEIDEDFKRFHAENPQVYSLLVQFSRVAKESGRKRFGIRMIWERMRWYVAIETKGDEYKLNDHWHSRYARLIMEQEPDLAGFFETRELRA